jgi:hypothetical protein
VELWAALVLLSLDPYPDPSLVADLTDRQIIKKIISTLDSLPLTRRGSKRQQTEHSICLDFVPDVAKVSVPGPSSPLCLSPSSTD